MTDVSKRTITILLLIFFFPLGILFMWGRHVFSRKTRMTITLAFLFTILLGFAMIIWWTTLPGYLY